jgi:Holliday junction resolvase RusA-like endonuclease
MIRLGSGGLKALRGAGNKASGAVSSKASEVSASLSERLATAGFGKGGSRRSFKSALLALEAERRASSELAPEPSDEIRFSVSVRPVPKERARIVSGGSGAFTPRRTSEFSAMMERAADEAMAGRAPFSGPVGGEIVFRMRIPPSWRASDRSAAADGELWPTMRPDQDNLVKAVLDAANGRLFVDDGQVCLLTVIKRYDEHPGVDVRIGPLRGESHRRASLRRRGASPRSDDFSPSSDFSGEIPELLDEVTFFVGGRVVPKERPRVVSNGRVTFTPRRTSEFSGIVGRAATAAMGVSEPFSGPVGGTFDFVLRIPPSWREEDRGLAAAGLIWPTMRPDQDNLAKAVLDSANGRLFADDGQVCWLRVRKRYGDVPGVGVVIGRLSGEGHARASRRMAKVSAAASADAEAPCGRSGGAVHANGSVG